MTTWKLVGAGLTLALGLTASVVGGPHDRKITNDDRIQAADADDLAKPPFRMNMEELHKHGGVPPGWEFSLPDGDAETGREVYIAMKCYTCHAVAGEQFPAHERDVGDVGPDLTGMGTHHPPEYFAETILNPSAVVVLGEGYTEADGLSRMPDYNDTLTVTQLIDLVAYLMSLKSEHHPVHAGGPTHEDQSRPAQPNPGADRSGPDADRVFHLSITQHKLADQKEVIRVHRGERVEIRWSTDQRAKLHLHGYDVETVVTPGAPTSFTFKAHATGRFPITLHRSGVHGAGSSHGQSHSHGQGETTLIYLEVLPR
ncbi:MAG: c-type cytochrome [Acidimicrobiia bacterium]